MDTSLVFLNSSNQVTWHKMGAYLNFFYNVLKTSQWSRVIAFKNKKIVLKLVELISKYKENF